MSQPRIISTDDVPTAQRFSYWVEEVVPHYLPLMMERSVCPADDFWARMIVAGGSACLMFQLNSCALDSSYRPDACRHCRLPELYSHALAFVGGQHADQATYVNQDGRSTMLGLGDCTLVDLQQPFASSIAGDNSRLYVCLPRHLIDAWIPPSIRNVGGRIDGTRGWGRMLSSYLGGLAIMLAENGAHSRLAGERFAQVSEHIVSLLSIALDERNGDAAPARGPRDSRRRRQAQAMLGWIREHHANPELGVADLARAFSVSVRQAHRMIALYSDAGRTFLDLLHGYRLASAMRMLADPKCQQLSIASIASTCGYADPSAFSRVFRTRLGQTPSAFRHARGCASREECD